MRNVGLTCYTKWLFIQLRYDHNKSQDSSD